MMTDGSEDRSSAPGAVYRSVLVTAGRTEDASLIVSSLSGPDVHITVTESFRHAKALIGSSPPDVLITGLRLGEYNGLHLVLRGKAMHPAMATLVLADAADEMLMTEADRLGATFLLKPVGQQDLLAAVMRTLHRRRSDPPLRPPFERRSGERRSSTALRPSALERRVSERRAAVYSSANTGSLFGLS